MFKILGELISWGFNIVVAGFNFLIAILKKFWAILIPAITTLFLFIKGFVLLVSEILVRLINIVDSMAFNARGDFSDVSADILYILSIGNTFFPLEEMFVMLITLSILWLSMITYRFIKSWIPTVN